MNSMRRLSGFLLLVLLGGCAIGVSPSAIAQPQKYRYRQAGSGGPVVVFEYGLGDRLETWKSVQDEVSRFTETFSYNRAGYAGSPAAVGTRDAATVVRELRALLADRKLSPPYLLVGHSLGGLYMQYYARNFPDEVSGLVLVDSTHWAQLERMAGVAPAVAAAAIAQGRSMSGVLRGESDALVLSEREVRDSPPLRPMPLTVLSAGRHPQAPQLSGGSRAGSRAELPATFWGDLQSELAAQLPNARHTIVGNSDHFIQVKEPKVVWAAVRDIVDTLRGW